MFILRGCTYDNPTVTRRQDSLSDDWVAGVALRIMQSGRSHLTSTCIPRSLPSRTLASALPLHLEKMCFLIHALFLGTVKHRDSSAGRLRLPRPKGTTAAKPNARRCKEKTNAEQLHPSQTPRPTNGPFSRMPVSQV